MVRGPVVYITAKVIMCNDIVFVIIIHVIGYIVVCVLRLGCVIASSGWGVMQYCLRITRAQSYTENVPSLLIPVLL